MDSEGTAKHRSRVQRRPGYWSHSVWAVFLYSLALAVAAKGQRHVKLLATETEQYLSVVDRASAAVLCRIERTGKADRPG